MLKEHALLWSWLNILNKKRYNALCEVYGNLDAASDQIDSEMLKGLGCRPDTIIKTLNRLEEFDAKNYAKELSRRNIHLYSIEDDDYPQILLSTEDHPVFLYIKGALEVLSQPLISIVGTRKMSSYGHRVVESFVPPIIRSSFGTVSGLAMGIDTSVATQTIESGGKTIAVLAHGLSKVFPRVNANLANNIISSGGVIVSEFPLDQTPDKYTFPARNRIIAGLGLATLVIEAGKKSGALITADIALGYGREVFAVPGQLFDPGFAGCHRFIAEEKARLAQSPESMLKYIGVHMPESNSKSKYSPINPNESSLWNVLTTMPKRTGDLIDQSGLDTGTLTATLTIMELQGAVQNIGNGQWIRA
ncbi:DNA-protecting protein DprA [Candidatus Peregrinibacteria bacterium]|jgi:DNA processing protein|nr:DNA-protecting protein DprA [Candidatus Peregrinibacteria bacterium]MBT3599103.1 DNA-protecting protein DprA [Candidatus Peregrinibacteria bacterium]MBT4367662.1 DNA-protecting protein DprA [Candidatus Peregrinibacteria bacterium]MBT4585440.1 DNA-protecting protein DprA [Candidatus Peregrinibacteria bacterium]MBT6730409.1 DNA-protecting protein DprA [Candidatus Peregrinibacteria bacterium]